MISLLNKYLAKGETTWKQVATRVSQLMPLSEQAETADAIERMLFVPSSPVLRCTGIGSLNIASCHALKVGNSIEEIWHTAYQVALILKSGGGGVGLDFSELSPRGTPLKYEWASSSTESNIATGPVSFLPLFEDTSLILGGAVPGKAPGLLVSLDIEHADFGIFTTAKDRGQFQRFNFTVTADHWPSVPDWKKDKIAQRILYNGDPALGFLDNVNRDNPLVKKLGWMRLFNICGEVPSWPYDVCFLASANLPALIKTSGDYGELRRIARLIVRLLDQAVEKNSYPLREQQEFARANRRIGAGPMGVSDWLASIGLDYASPEGIVAATEVAQVYRQAVEAASVELAGETRPFNKEFDRRHIVMMSGAPNGHIAQLAGVSPSIYPRLYDPIEYAKALKLTPKQHVDIIMAWQKSMDGGISYTANLSSDATVALVRELLDLAHGAGVKALAVYVDGSMAGQPCNVDGCAL